MEIALLVQILRGTFFDLDHDGYVRVGSIKAWQTCRSPEQPFFGTTIATNVGWTPCFLKTTLIFVPRRAWVRVHKIADAFSTVGVFSTNTGTEGVAWSSRCVVVGIRPR